MELAPADPLAVQLTTAVRSGALEVLARLLDEQPELANVRIARRRSSWHTPLHVATHWPEYFPNGPAVVRLLIETGADASAPSAAGPSETAPALSRQQRQRRCRGRANRWRGRH